MGGGARKAKMKEVGGLKELYLVQNKLGAFWIKCMLEALKFDDYVRVIDLRKNRLTKQIVQDEQLDLVRSLQRNEALTNIDFRNNECFDRQLKFKLSLIMIRNIDKL